MTTLTTAPLAPLLDRLFGEAEAATSPAMAALSRVERDRLMRSKTEYLRLYGLMKDLWLPVSRGTGVLLYMLVRSTRARNIVEFGTSFGISTLHMAAALHDNGGGRLITSEFEPSKVARAREHLTEGGLIDLVEIREGDALKTLGPIFPTPLTCCCSTERKRSIRKFSASSKSRLRPVRSSSRTMPIFARNIWSACARRAAASRPRHSRKTSSFPCAWAEPWPVLPTVFSRSLPNRSNW